MTKLAAGGERTIHEEYYKQFFYHSDHLGSANLITDYRGDEYQRIEYTPYGEIWVEEQRVKNEALVYLPYKFTGKERDEETGLYYYGARYLDPKYSHWMSTDPALGEYMAGSKAGMGGAYNSVNLNLYHYAGNNPIKYTDPTGMCTDNEDGTLTAKAGYLNDGDAVKGAGHSAMFVETFDKNGKSNGFALYEVGNVANVDGTWRGLQPDNEPLDKSTVLSHEPLDRSMGSVGGSVLGASGIASGSGSIAVGASAAAGSASGSSAVGSVDLEAGVFVRYYASYDEMKNAPENSRYNTAITFSITRENAIAIRNEAETTGRNFGQYNLFTNNCTQHASNALSKGGINTTQFLIPNVARNYILSNNSNYKRESWRRK